MTIPEGWHAKPLGDFLALIRNGYSGRQVPEITNYPVSRIETISDGSINTAKVGYVTSIPKSYLLETGDILFSNINSLKHIGKVAQLRNGEFLYHGMNLLILRPADCIDKFFLFYKLIGQKAWFQKMAAQAINQASINQETLKELLLEVPSGTQEQAKISEILLTVDRAIEQTGALIAKQQRVKTGLMHDLLTRGIDGHGNLRSERTHRFKDSPLGRIPVDWNVKRLEDACEVCNGLRKPIAALVRETMKGDYPYYGPTGILDYINEYRVEGKFVLIGEDGDHFLKFDHQEMTLLVDGRFNVNNHAHILRGKGDVKTEWLHLFFLHRDITLNLTRQGAGRFKLNKASLQNLLLLVPEDPSEQDRILSVMDSFRDTQARNAESLNKLEMKKVALMQDLLTGRKRVTPLLELEHTPLIENVL